MPCVEHCDESFARDPPRIDAQAEWRPRVAGVENRGKTLRVVGAHTLDPPVRVRKTRFRIARDLRKQGVPAAEKIAQNGIHHPFRRGAPDARGGAHGAIDHHVHRRGGVHELVERDPEERLDVGVRERSIRKCADDRLELPEETQRSVRKLVNQRAIITPEFSLGCESLRQRRAREDAPHRLGRDALRSLHRAGSKSPKPPSRAGGGCAPRSAGAC